MRKVFRAHGAWQGMCDNSIIYLKLLTNQQRDGDISVESLVTGLLEKKSQRYHGRDQEIHRSGHHDAVNVGGLRQGIQSFQWLSQSVESNGDLGVSVWILQPGSSSAKKFD